MQADNNEPKQQRMDLPSVDRLLGLASVQGLVSRHGRTAVVKAVRELIASARSAAMKSGGNAQDWGDASVGALLDAQLEEAARPGLRQVFNLTGTVLHTNLGRAPLPEEAVHAVGMAMRSAC